MARTVMLFNHPTVKIADTEAGLSAGDAWECQITQFIWTPTPKTNTVPSTGCAGESTAPGLTGWAVDVAWLQDMSAPGGGLSLYTVENDGAAKWVEFTYDTTAVEPTTATAEVYLTPGAVGGVFGDGSPGLATATWGVVSGAPAFVTPAAVP